MARQETTNKGLIQWNVLLQVFCHDLTRHSVYVCALSHNQQLKMEIPSTTMQLRVSKMVAAKLLTWPQLKKIRQYTCFYYCLKGGGKLIFVEHSYTYLPAPSCQTFCQRLSAGEYNYGCKSEAEVRVENCWSDNLASLPVDWMWLGRSKMYCCLRHRESNPGLPRDRRGYQPLYYDGRLWLCAGRVYRALTMRTHTLFTITT